jgi:hypothetical protein
MDWALADFILEALAVSSFGVYCWLTSDFLKSLWLRKLKKLRGEKVEALELIE